MKEEININIENNYNYSPDFLLEEVESGEENLLTDDEVEEIDHTVSKNKDGNAIELQENFFVKEVFQTEQFQDYLEKSSIQTEFRARSIKILADALKVYSQDRENDLVLKIFNPEHKLKAIRNSFSKAVQHLFFVLSSDIQLLKKDQDQLGIFDDSQLFIACKKILAKAKRESFFSELVSYGCNYNIFYKELRVLVDDAMHGRTEISVKTNETLLRTFAINNRILSENLESEKTRSNRHKERAKKYKNKFMGLSKESETQGATSMKQKDEITTLTQDLKTTRNQNKELTQTLDEARNQNMNLVQGLDVRNRENENLTQSVKSNPNSKYTVKSRAK